MDNASDVGDEKFQPLCHFTTAFQEAFPAWLIRGLSKFIRLGLKPTSEAEEITSAIGDEHRRRDEIMILFIRELDDMGLIKISVSLVPHELLVALLLGDSPLPSDRTLVRAGGPLPV